MILLAGGLTLGHLSGFSLASLGAMLTALTEGGLGLLIVIAAGGYGYLAIRKLAPPSAPPGLRVVTGCGLGLWLLSTAVLVIGTTFTGLLKHWFWWPIIAVGVMLAVWQGRRRLETWRLPRHFDGRSLIWPILAIAAGLWLAGATRPAGAIQTPDAYDVLEYHLQVPREFYLAQHIGQLPHNCYSYYPLGSEMLFLLAMCLRHGPYEGMYLAKMIHGTFAVLAVAAVFAALKRQDESRGRFSAVLLGTVPSAIYLSWLGMVDLAMVFYMALAALWLREWLSHGGIRAAACIGLALGAGCAAKYLSVGLIVAPVLAAMIVGCLLSRKRLSALTHLPVVCLLAGALFCPWLIRNAAYTANPFFPLATQYFGRGHWSAASEQRWVDGHSPGVKPPVPVPPSWKPPAHRSRTDLLYDNLGLLLEWFGPIAVLLAGVGICVVIAGGGRDPPYEAALAVILVGQVAIWMTFTHQMPLRFLVPAMVPISLLAGGVLGQLAAVATSPFRRLPQLSAGAPWGRPIAVALAAAAVAINLLIAYSIYRRCTDRVPIVHGLPGRIIAERFPPWNEASKLPEGCRILLLGDAKAFYFPPQTIYATVFDAQLLDAIAKQLQAHKLTPEQAAERLRAKGITHIYVDWREILRLAKTYGFPALLSGEVVQRRQNDQPPALKLLEKLPLRLVKHIELARPPATSAPTTKAAIWPLASIYALPWAPDWPETAPAATPFESNR